MSTRILSTDSETLARQKQNYQSLIANNYAERWREDDEIPHIEDTDLYPVIRNGETIYVTYNQIKPEEHRAAHVALFDPCGLEVY